jgi:phosphoglycolate phosphatase-like HAD superfamily hydrolase
MIVACDIDHTLRHAARRDDLMPLDPRGDWDPYHEASREDKPATVIINVVIALHNAGHEIYIVTAIPRKWKRMVYSWLHNAGILVESDHILMRSDNVFRPSPEVKQELLSHLNVDLLIEDRLDVVEAFAKDGVTTLQVRLVQ